MSRSRLLRRLPEHEPRADRVSSDRSGQDEGRALRDQLLALLRAESEALGADEPAVALVSRKWL